jgi:hypothetical protein
MREMVRGGGGRRKGGGKKRRQSHGFCSLSLFFYYSIEYMFFFSHMIRHELLVLTTFSISCLTQSSVR